MPKHELVYHIEGERYNSNVLLGMIHLANLWTLSLLFKSKCMME